MKRRSIVAVALGLVLQNLTLATAATADPMPPEMVSFLNSFQPRFEDMARNPSLDLLGPLNGIWIAERGDDNQSIDIIHIANVGPYLIETIVNPATGSLSEPIGYAEAKGGAWVGWFSIACKGCCPGKNWWDEGVATAGEGGLAVRVDTVKLDPDTCELGTTPDVVDLRSSLLNGTQFGEFLPGKLISIVSSPAVGNQPAQYKAAVKLVWDYSGYGITRLDLVVNGPGGGAQILASATNIASETQYVTDRPGNYRFLMVAYNSAGNPLHFEIESIEIPNIPGIN